VGELLFDAICNRHTKELPGSVMRDLSLFVAGYRRARG